MYVVESARRGVFQKVMCLLHAPLLIMTADLRCTNLSISSDSANHDMQGWMPVSRKPIARGKRYLALYPQQAPQCFAMHIWRKQGPAFTHD